jgi:ferredoxin-NADP reductase
MAQNGQIVRPVSQPGSVLILAHGDAQTPVLAVLDTPSAIGRDRSAALTANRS